MRLKNSNGSSIFLFLLPTIVFDLLPTLCFNYLSYDHRHAFGIKRIRNTIITNKYVCALTRPNKGGRNFRYYMIHLTFFTQFIIKSHTLTRSAWSYNATRHSYIHLTRVYSVWERSLTSFSAHHTMLSPSISASESVVITAKKGCVVLTLRYVKRSTKSRKGVILKILSEAHCNCSPLKTW